MKAKQEERDRPVLQPLAKWDLSAEPEPLVREVFQQMPVAVVIVDAGKKRAFANGAAQELLGAGASSRLEGGSLPPTHAGTVIGTAVEYPSEEHPLARALKGEPSAVGDLAIHRPDAVVHAEVQGVPIFDGQGHLRFAVAVYLPKTTPNLREIDLARATSPSRTVEANTSTGLTHGPLATAQIVEELQHRNSETALLNEMGDFLQSCLRMEEAYAVITQYGQRLFGSDSGTLFMLSHSKSLVEQVAGWGSLQGHALFSPEDCWALRRGKAHVMEDPASPLLCNHVGKIEGACICIPLIAQGEKLGVLQLVSDTGTVGSYASHGSHPEQQRTLASAFAERIAMALANLRLSESLRASSIRDPLTGLFNRRYLEETLDRELHRAARGDHPVALIMCDVDHLKSLNDTLGHQAGDELLRELGSLLHRQVRGEDLACRYGGDEFLLILPEASLDVALERCEVLRKAVAEMAVPHEGRPLERLSLSLGVAGYPEHGSQPAELMAAADAALRKAKDRGRNRVVRATAL